MDICRFQPLAVALAGIYQVSLSLSFQFDPGCKRPSPSSAAFHHKTGVAFHWLIPAPQNFPVTIELPETVWQQDSQVGPAHATVHRPHVKVHTAIGGDLRQPPALFLPIKHIPQVFFGKCSVVKQVPADLKKIWASPVHPCRSLVGQSVGISRLFPFVDHFVIS